MITELTPPANDPRGMQVITRINEQNKALADKDRQDKYGKMNASAFVFFRGTNHLFWADFAGDARLLQFGGFKTRTWLQGDLHIENFGAFGNDEGVVVYDINDFDEAVIADYQYDLWRMAVSIVLAAQEQGDLSRKEQKKVVETFARKYLETLATYCAQAGERDAVFDRENASGRLKKLLEKVEKKNNRAEMLADWTAQGQFLTDEQPDDEDKKPAKLAAIPDALRAEIMAAMEPYATKSLANLPAGADDEAYFQVRDIARRLSAGTGSLGTPRFYVLIQGENDQLETDRILDVKRQSIPVPYQYLADENLREYDFFTRELPGRDAIWHAAAYRAMARDTDDHLGWMELSDGFYSVRERSFYKESINVAKLNSEKRFKKLAEQWGMILATDHARALTDFDNDFPHIDLTQVLFRPESDQKAFKCQVTKRTAGKTKEFTDLVQKVAFAYAQQVSADWETFKVALSHSQN